MEINNEYIIYKLIKTNFGDPISSILLTSNHVIIGTMLGQISYFSLLSKKITILSEFNSENISNISYNRDDEIINISIGDEKIFRYKKDKEIQKNYIFFKNNQIMQMNWNIITFVKMLIHHYHQNFYLEFNYLLLKKNVLT